MKTIFQMENKCNEQSTEKEVYQEEHDQAEKDSSGYRRYSCSSV